MVEGLIKGGGIGSVAFTLPSSFAQHAQKLYPLVELPLPFEFIPLAYVLLWHERNADDPGHRWVKEIICESVANAFSSHKSLPA